MNEIVPVSRLAQLLAESTGHPVDWCEKFVREYFGVAESALAAGENVVVKGFGTFRLTSHADMPVEFIPDASLAASVNAAFEAFKPIELADDEEVDEPDVLPAENVEESTEPQENTLQQPEIIPEPEKVAEQTVEQEEEPADAPDELPAAVQEEAPVDVQEKPHVDAVVEQPVSEEIPAPAEDAEQPALAEDAAEIPEPVTVPKRKDFIPDIDGDDDDETEINKLLVFWFIVVFLVGILLGIAIGFFGHNKITYMLTGVNLDGMEVVSHEETDTDSLASDSLLLVAAAGHRQADAAISGKSADSVVAAPSQNKKAEVPAEKAAPASNTAKAPVYENVSKNYFLASMARRHYGRMEYWVYIYKANEGLGNPDRIKPGKRVRIPDISELPLTGNADADKAAARRLEREIYAKYRR